MDIHVVVQGNTLPTESDLNEMIANTKKTHKTDLILNCLYLLIALLIWAIQIALVYYKIIPGVALAVISGAVSGLIVGCTFGKLLKEVNRYKATIIALEGLLQFVKKMEEKKNDETTKV